MKMTKVMKRALACGLAFSMVVTGVNTNMNAASAAKKKKPKLNKTKVNVAVGSTVTLTVKKANKKVTWKTSNKKVAKITKKSGKKKSVAVIKGLKKGSAVITAKVGGKKLKCKVKVSGPAIKSVAVDALDSSALVMTLKKKTALNASDITVNLKSFKEGKFNRQPVVDAISTTDQKTYYVYLSQGVPNGDFIQVSMGAKKKKITTTVQNKKPLVADKNAETTLLWEKGGTYVVRLSEYFNNYIGNVSYSVKKGSALPEGMTLVGKRGILKGIPTIVGNTEFTIQAEDELGRKADVKLMSKVYDDVTLAALDMNIKEDCRVDDYTADRATVANPNPVVDEDNAYKSIEIEPKGGSGRYTFVLTANDVTGARLSTDRIINAATGQTTQDIATSTTLYIPQSIAAGSHVFTVTVTDSADSARTTTSNITVNAVQYFNVSGIVRDSFQSMLASNEELFFVPKDAVSMKEYIPLRTFLKYEKVTSEYYEGTKLTGGNHHKAYSADSVMHDQVNDLVTYRVYKHDYSALVGPLPMATAQAAAPAPGATQTPAPTGYQVPDVPAGTYNAELPAGEYVVKLLAPNNVFYNTGANMTIAADGTQDVTVPVRFANVMATAKYANGNIVENRRVYFESANKKYEGWDFSVMTDYTGSFKASLPVGVYSAYVLDETGKKQYFTTDITVTDASADVAVGDLVLGISRYTVEGVVSEKKADGTTAPLGKGALYIYNDKGICQTVYSNTYYDDVDSVGSYNSETGAFKLILADGNYSLRYRETIEYGEDFYITRTVGTFAVAGANISGLQLTHDFAAETAAAVVVNTDGSQTTYTSTGNNDIFAKVTPAENGSYEIVTSYLNGKAVRPVVLDGTGKKLERESGKNNSETQTSAFRFKMNANETYFIFLQSLDSESMDQRIGSTTLSITKVQPSYVKNSVEVTEGGSSVKVTCSSDVSESDMYDTAYVKFTAAGKQSYELKAGTYSSAVESLSFTLMDANGKELSYDYSSNAENSVFEFSVPSAGTYYVKIYAYMDYDASASVSVSLGKSQNTEPTDTPDTTEKPDQTSAPTNIPDTTEKPDQTNEPA